MENVTIWKMFKKVFCNGIYLIKFMEKFNRLQEKKLTECQVHGKCLRHYNISTLYLVLFIP